MSHEPMSPEDLAHFRAKMLRCIAESINERGCSLCAPELAREWVKVTIDAAIKLKALPPTAALVEILPAPKPTAPTDPAKQRRDDLEAAAIASDMLARAREGD